MFNTADSYLSVAHAVCLAP